MDSKRKTIFLFVCTSLLIGSVLLSSIKTKDVENINEKSAINENNNDSINSENNNNSFNEAVEETGLETDFVIFGQKMNPTCIGNISKIVHGCIDSKLHKDDPTVEDPANMGVCNIWSEDSCCTPEVAQEITISGAEKLYNMNWDQCPEFSPLSDKCRNFLIQDQCFYDCSGILKPYFFDSVDTKTRNTRFVNVPLCYQDCVDWFTACSDDYTCADNWTNGGFDWVDGKNVCKQPCKKFSEWFDNATQFCERLFDGSFKVTSPNEPCISLSPADKEDYRKSLSRSMIDAIDQFHCDFDGSNISKDYIYIIAGVFCGMALIIVSLILFVKIRDRKLASYTTFDPDVFDQN